MRDGSKRSPALTVQGLEDSLVRAAFDSNPLPMWIYDEETLRVLAVNDCALDCFGHRREQFPAMPMTVLETMPESGLEREGADGTLRHHRKPDGTLLAMRLQTSGLEIDGCRARQPSISRPLVWSRIARSVPSGLRWCRSVPSAPSRSSPDSGIVSSTVIGMAGNCSRRWPKQSSAQSFTARTRSVSSS